MFGKIRLDRLTPTSSERAGSRSYAAAIIAWQVFRRDGLCGLATWMWMSSFALRIDESWLVVPLEAQRTPERGGAG